MLPSGILVIILIKKDHVETINFVINRTWFLIWNFVKVNVRIEHISCPIFRLNNEDFSIFLLDQNFVNFTGSYRPIVTADDGGGKYVHRRPRT